MGGATGHVAASGQVQGGHNRSAGAAYVPGGVVLEALV
ncbi:hypothetical protein AF72_13445 [Xylella taiwanensis]|uniref:Uncharacterized protein n=1 Tax=Xylella taiwanensis TaxID=1444770 RepID=Z9JEY0_9GAMM|nr:hypothetical protein AF72_13445 [Xylella taiwanensis]